MSRAESRGGNGGKTRGRRSERRLQTPGRRLQAANDGRKRGKEGRTLIRAREKSGEQLRRRVDRWLERVGLRVDDG
jgi:hypothetical protein